MIKIPSAVHRQSQADALFREEVYGIAHCFAVDGTDKMYHGTKSSIKDRLLFFRKRPPAFIVCTH